MRRKQSPKLVILGAVALVAGATGTALWSIERGAWPVPFFGQLREATRLEPVLVFPRTMGVLSARDAAGALDSGRPWEAWRLVRDEVFEDDAVATHVLLGARAAAGWEGWTTIRTLLADREWLATAESGQGLFLLARAEEELNDAGAAAALYRRYLANPDAPRRGEAYARLGRVLSELRDPRGAAEAYQQARRQLPEVDDWLSALQLEKEVEAGGSATTPVGEGWRSASAAARVRRVRAEVAGWIGAGDANRALARLEVEERVLHAQAALTEAAELRVARAQLLAEDGRGDEARTLLRLTAAEEGVAPAIRVQAAQLLGETTEEQNGQEELAMAAAYEAAGRPGLAARELRAAIEAGATSDPAAYMRAAKLLFEERDYGPARAAFQRAAEVVEGEELLAEAAFYAARSLYLGTPSRRSAALTEYRAIAERYPEAPAAGSALFYLGDAASTISVARTYYRRAAAIARAPEARQALERAGDRALRMRDQAAAIQAWEEYASRYPTGDATARLAYQTGKLHESAGRESRARAMFTAAMLAEPTSYYAMRAGDKLDAHPVDAVLREPRPWVGLATDPAAAGVVLRKLELLQSIGLTAEWEAELASAQRTLAQRPAALIALAEGIRDQGHPVAAINMGRQLLAQRDGKWDVRLLRVVFPLLYRDLLIDEADRAGVEPMLLAGLVRQESSFRRDARSRVDATGLGQIMPATGRWLAPNAGIRNFDTSLLEVPEINLRLAAGYLSDLLDRYDGAADLALAGYNAGPGRADRWRRQLPSRDRDAFRDAIPFDETREYVRLVLRNAELYARLYSRGE